MMTRKQMSLRHANNERYTLVSSDPDGTSVIENSAGRRARVKTAWLDIDGQVCWAGGFRKALHIGAAEWVKEV